MSEDDFLNIGTLEFTEVELGLSELRRRLNDPDEAAKIPATGLINLLLAQEKRREREDENRKHREEQPVRGNAVELILLMDLSPERKRALLEEERDRLEKEYARVISLLVEDEDGT